MRIKVMMQKPENVIRDIQMHLEKEFEHGPFDGLKYRLPEGLRKNGRYTVVGNILGKASGHIWSAGWCFYQVVVPVPPVDYYGSVNFICYSRNKQCGGGKHTKAVWEILDEFCKQHPDFSLNERDSDFVGLYKRYWREKHAQMPSDEALTDLRRLISSTFAKLNLLVV